ncbi:hypothetical protein M0657_000829 [Pyricularia oryzae]|uniref:Uncharacterized protein n=1 Tax=Pyricularia oryzae TaxID=318829 RepID=A0A4P7NCM3_PYROR|nr:hypothetical protein M9X92_000864 [Pyricularia oryzae]KAI7932104.1 hypothetical protein M0657_000829 [Pyricularia oryzae]QBZ59256.1 hypothetical protein PoMZ_04217 [Pyricularia oryzae]
MARDQLTVASALYELSDEETAVGFWVLFDKYFGLVSMWVRGDDAGSCGFFDRLPVFVLRKGPNSRWGSALREIQSNVSGRQCQSISSRARQILLDGRFLLPLCKRAKLGPAASQRLSTKQIYDETNIEDKQVDQMKKKKANSPK